jgi:hypothetical protein
VEARFSVPIQKIPEANPASCTSGAGTFSVVKKPELGADRSLPSNLKVANALEL